jgi:Tetratricopeptide repeat
VRNRLQPVVKPDRTATNQFCAVQSSGFVYFLIVIEPVEVVVPFQNGKKQDWTGPSNTSDQEEKAGAERWSSLHLLSMGYLATTYVFQGCWNDADALEVLVMEKSKQVLGDDHPHTLLSMENLANTYTRATGMMQRH